MPRHPLAEVELDEEMAQNGHRQSGKGRGNRAGSDFGTGERQTLRHEGQLPPFSAEIKFPEEHRD